jgi:predicted DNA-binding protein (UPF0251 family)
MFKPQGLPLSSLEIIEIYIDEFEAVRLIDYEGFSQIEGADKMKISRSSFQRILESGRKKILDALINNKAFKITNQINNYILEDLK